MRTAVMARRGSCRAVGSHTCSTIRALVSLGKRLELTCDQVAGVSTGRRCTTSTSGFSTAALLPFWRGRWRCRRWRGRSIRLLWRQRRRGPSQSLPLRWRQRSGLGRKGRRRPLLCQHQPLCKPRKLLCKQSGCLHFPRLLLVCEPHLAISGGCRGLTWRPRQHQSSGGERTARVTWQADRTRKRRVVHDSRPSPGLRVHLLDCGIGGVHLVQSGTHSPDVPKVVAKPLVQHELAGWALHATIDESDPPLFEDACVAAPRRHVPT